MPLGVFPFCIKGSGVVGFVAARFSLKLPSELLGHIRTLDIVQVAPTKVHRSAFGFGKRTDSAAKKGQTTYKVPTSVRESSVSVECPVSGTDALLAVVPVCVRDPQCLAWLGSAGGRCPVQQ